MEKMRVEEGGWKRTVISLLSDSTAFRRKVEGCLVCHWLNFVTEAKPLRKLHRKGGKTMNKLRKLNDKFYLEASFGSIQDAIDAADALINHLNLLHRDHKVSQSKVIRTYKYVIRVKRWLKPC